MKSLPFILILLLSSIYLSGQGYIIEDYDIDVTLEKNGTFDITEMIEVNFSEERRGIMRNIPKSILVAGEKQRISLSDVDVQGHPYKVLSEGNDRIIRTGEKSTYLTGRQSYTLNYKVGNAYIFENDHIAFQYNLISGWDTEVSNMDYTINLPDDINLSNSDLLMMTGNKGERNKHVSMTLDGQTITGRSLTDIPANGNATIAIKLPLGYIAKPLNPMSWEVMKTKKGWLAPLAGLFGLLALYRKNSKNDYKIDGPIPDQYFAPKGFSPALVGAYYDHKVQRRTSSLYFLTGPIMDI